MQNQIRQNALPSEIKVLEKIPSKIVIVLVNCIRSQIVSNAISCKNITEYTYKLFGEKFLHLIDDA